MSFDDTEIEETIKICHDENDGYILCPHTAVAVKYFYKMKLDQSRYLMLVHIMFFDTYTEVETGDNYLMSCE